MSITNLLFGRMPSPTCASHVCMKTPGATEEVRRLRKEIEDFRERVAKLESAEKVGEK